MSEEELACPNCGNSQRYEFDSLKGAYLCFRCETYFDDMEKRES